MNVEPKRTDILGDQITNLDRNLLADSIDNISAICTRASLCHDSLLLQQEKFNWIAAGFQKLKEKSFNRDAI